jgi:hypothetical protein
MKTDVAEIAPRINRLSTFNKPKTAQRLVTTLKQFI